MYVHPVAVPNLLAKPSRAGSLSAGYLNLRVEYSSTIWLQLLESFTKSFAAIGPVGVGNSGCDGDVLWWHSHALSVLHVHCNSAPVKAISRLESIFSCKPHARLSSGSMSLERPTLAWIPRVIFLLALNTTSISSPLNSLYSSASWYEDSRAVKKVWYGSVDKEAAIVMAAPSKICPIFAAWSSQSAASSWIMQRVSIQI